MTNSASATQPTRAATACYHGHCPAHEWDGMRREDHGTAEADLTGHVELFPDEDHSGATVVSC